MTLPGDGDPTRRHASVTAGLVAIAALVIVVVEDPAQRRVPDAAGLASGRVAATARPDPVARQANFRQFDASARLVMRPAIMTKTMPALPRR